MIKENEVVLTDEQEEKDLIGESISIVNSPLAEEVKTSSIKEAVEIKGNTLTEAIFLGSILR